MAGIYIPGVKMPESCFVCMASALLPWGASCLILNEHLDINSKSRRRDDCPLVEVQYHGRLIDADAFDERVRIAGGMADEELTDDFKDGIQVTLLMLKTQTTIIPADEEV